MKPIASQIYMPALELLSKEGITFVEETIENDNPGENEDVKTTSKNTESPLFDKNSRIAQRPVLQQRVWPFVTASENLNGHQD